MQSRSQAAYRLAAELVPPLAAHHEEVRRIYTGLWKDFPVMVMHAGLAQAVCYHVAKAAGEGNRALAHGLLLEHSAQALALNGAADLERAATTDPCWDYMERTRRMIEVAPFFQNISEALFGELSGAGR